MNSQPVKKKNYIPEYIVAAGYLLFFCLAIALCTAVSYFTLWQTGSVTVVNPLTTALPPTTSTPHFLPTNQQAATKVIIDNFNNDQYHWEQNDGWSITEIKDGKLFLESRSQDSFAIAECPVKFCSLADLPYFIKADFSTDISTDQIFGIIFDRSLNANRFYLFAIDTETKQYYLYHHASDNWSLRASGETSQIKSFPAVNNLGVYVTNNVVELYINGVIVDSYVETNQTFQRGQFSFYTNNPDYKLIVDNLVISR
jgi:hypothetical protein